MYLRYCKIAAYLFCLALLGVFACQEAKAITIASWNIQNLIESEKNIRSERDYRRLRDIARQLDADIIAIQEVGSEELIEKIFPPSEYEVEIADRNRYLILGTPDRQKTAIVIRKGISYKRKDDYEKLDVGNTRYGTIITTKIRGRDTTIMSVHLKAGCWHNKYDKIKKSCEKLHKQASYLKGWVKKRVKKEQAFIILGDFNRQLAARGDNMWEKISNSGKYKIKLAAGSNKSECWSNSRREFIDHIIVAPVMVRYLNRRSFNELVFEEASNGEAFFSRSKHRISDHCPVSIEF